jgi:ribosomal protein S18 acetylase RimI-like enzyme
MKITFGQAPDLEEIFHLLTACGVHMREQGILQWNAHYPDRASVENDLQHKNLRLIRINSRIAGVISRDENQSPEYQTVSWSQNEGKILVIHRLAVHPEFQGKGIARELMDDALAFAQENQYAAIRLDAYSKNPRTLKFYLSRGYEKRGEIYFPYREDPFYCFEKVLE